MGDLQNHIIKGLMGIVETELMLLKGKQKTSLEEYMNDIELQHVVERALQNAIQACIDIGARIISRMSFRKAESYHDIFDILSQYGIIDPNLRDKMHELVGLRNILVHEYRLIEHREVYRHLRESPIVLEELAEKIAGFLERHEEEGA
ncbi:TPA: DUF86 domain-containing protein [Candidatus Poribacteria bacterium]|nr:DUF86 domain-containing protein [Candidatus Poribacteria bacterium]HEX28647.1 DUF86 domain-containing protein [Candidatus Poribacteria bacterium]